MICQSSSRQSRRSCGLLLMVTIFTLTFLLNAQRVSRRRSQITLQHKPQVVSVDTRQNTSQVVSVDKMQNTSQVVSVDMMQNTSQVVSSIQVVSPAVEFLKPCIQQILIRVRFPSVLPLLDKRYGIEAIFVLHYKPLSHRKHSIKDHVLSVFHSEPIWVEELDAEELTDADIECVSNRIIQRAYISRHTSRGEDSLALKHMAVYNFMVNQNLTNVLVLEDDATFLTSDWLTDSSLWKSILRELPLNYDMVMLSGFSSWHNHGAKVGEHLYLAQTSRVSSMYLVSQKGALNMLRTLPIVGPLDWIMNWAGGHDANGVLREPIPPAPVKDMAIFWSEPPMSSQLDTLGISSLSAGRDSAPRVR
jgi:GR25 family glycosyltransferase involved in LPS biosynthesis